ncbi:MULTISPECIES: aldo/keto reductase [Megasphaera]|uniref:Aldo/keto reductase n=1 Tax=Megasphaera stantonii TaxID=2144175 RepID=A0A346AYU2_9FIRM|nr:MULTISPECIES: aldo/keto reductase [Megasphaera]AXL21035.1 aldo/keto reductase [Megasphaera stantonii]NJE34070.1 aldo/keto reductase [Megasphaera sp. SW808]
MNTVTLNNGVAMPVLGLGVYQIDDASLCEQIVRDALRAGYRLIDTAAAYGNEEAVGRAVKRSGVPREDIFITTKVWVQDFGYEKTKRAVAASLEKLDMAYVDLVLLHQQLSDYYGSWRALQELCRQGSVRAIGVSNFYPDRLADLCENADILPAVNQIECHPFYQRAYDLDVMKKLRVAPMAWGPFAEGGHDIWNNPILKKIAAKHGKTVAQVALRFTLQRGVIVIPKTVHKDRLIENMAVWDFELDGEDMAQIAALDTDRTEIIDHLTVHMVQFLNRHKIHE